MDLADPPLLEVAAGRTSDRFSSIDSNLIYILCSDRYARERLLLLWRQFPAVLILGASERRGAFKSPAARFKTATARCRNRLPDSRRRLPHSKRPSHGSKQQWRFQIGLCRSQNSHRRFQKALARFKTVVAAFKSVSAVSKPALPVLIMRICSRVLRYRLSGAGLQPAEQIARALIAEGSPKP